MIMKLLSNGFSERNEMSEKLPSTMGFNNQGTTLSLSISHPSFSIALIS